MRLFFVFITLILISSCQKSPLFDNYFEEINSYVEDIYFNQLSYEIGDTVHVFISSSIDTTGHIAINNCLDEVIFSKKTQIFKQYISNKEPWRLGYGYDTTFSFVLSPSIFVSGIYFINETPIIIKPSQKVDFLVIIPTNTIIAYNNNGGRSHYSNPPAISGTYLRSWRSYSPLNHVSYYDSKSSEKLRISPFVEYLYKSNYSYGYVSDFDFHNQNYENIADNFIIPGHSEFWSYESRKKIDHYNELGKNLLIFSGNTMWKRISYGSQGNIISDYNASDENYLTSFWMNPKSEYNIYESIGSDFNNGGYGLMNDNGWNGYKVIDENNILFKNTSLKNEDIIYLKSIEHDGSLISHFDDGIPKYQNPFNFYKTKHIAFDKINRSNGDVLMERYPSIHILRKTRSSGLIINVNSTDWCTYNGIGSLSSGDIIKIITSNMFDVVLNNTPDSLIF